MISYIDEKPMGGKKYATVVCLSSDTKPGGDLIANGSILLEMDTKKTYLFDAANDTWRQFSA